MNPNQQQQTPPQDTPPEQTPPPVPGAIPEQQTPPPAQQGSYSQPIPDEKKRVYHPKQFMLALSIFVAACLLGVVIMVLVTLMPESSTKNKTSPSDTKTDIVENPIPAELAISHVKEYFKGTETARTALMLPVQPPDTAYYTVIPDIKPLSSVAGAVPAAAAQAQLTSIVHSLEGDKFTPNVISDGTENTNYQAYFTREDTICEVDAIKTADPAANQWIEVKCLDMTTYIAYAKAQAPFTSLYTPLTSTSVQYGFVGKPDVKAGGVAGYQTVRLQVSSVINDHLATDGQYALFYKTLDGIWHYFSDQDNQVVISCNLYNNNDIKSAYAGQTCRVNSNGTTKLVEAPKTKK